MTTQGRDSKSKLHQSPEKSKVASKVIKVDDLSLLSQKARTQQKKIVHCHGVFDLLHLGHVRHLNSAKQLGDILVVSILADRFVKRGPGRPVFNHDLRAEMLANMEMVDYVTVVHHHDAVPVVKALRPVFFAKGTHRNDGLREFGAISDTEERAVKAVGGKVIFTDDVTFSSTQLLNQYLDAYPEKTTKFLKKIASDHPITQITSLFEKIQNMRILVIGDTIIDQYHYCTPLAKSAKENIIVNKYIREEDYAGGTLATANHVAQLSKKVDMVTMLGSDTSHEQFIRKKMNPHIKSIFFRRPEKRTIVKRRFVQLDNNKKLFEVCFLDDEPLNSKEEKPVISFLSKQLHKYDLVIVSDFGHGMITNTIIKLLCSKAKKLAINVQTNSANLGFNLVTKYPKADLVCIDQPELHLATADKYSPLEVLIKKLFSTLKCKEVMVTRGAAGSVSFTKKGGFTEAPAFASRGIDSVGTGDALFAYVAPCFAAGASQELLGFIGNAVGSLKLQIVGNKEPVTKGELVRFITRLLKV